MYIIFAYIMEHNINAQEFKECLVYYKERTKKRVRNFLKVGKIV